MEKNFETLMEDQKFVEKIMQTESKEEVKKAFEAEGVKITDEQLNSLGKFFNEIIEKLSTLNEDELQAVAGGIFGSRPTATKQLKKSAEKAVVTVATQTCKAMEDVAKNVTSEDIQNFGNRVRNMLVRWLTPKPDSAPESTPTETKAGGISPAAGVGIGAAGTAAVAGAGYLIYKNRNKIKSWFR